MTKNTIGIIDVVLDFFDKFQKFRSYDNLFISLSTSPLVNAKDYQKAIKLFKNGDFNTLKKVKKNSNSIFQSMKIKNDLLEPVFQSNIKKYNFKEETFHPDGNVHIVKIKKLLEFKAYVIDPILPFQINSKFKIDIDEKSDYEYLLYLVEKKLIAL